MFHAKGRSPDDEQITTNNLQLPTKDKGQKTNDP